MIRLPNFRRGALSVAFIGLIGLVSHSSFAANAPGGFFEPVGSAQSRQVLSKSQINNLLPNRGKFTFPAPYGTEGYRLTNPSDCGGSDCVHYVGYSYWRNINNHVGQTTMLIMVGLRRSQGGGGPSLIAYNKQTDQVSALGPIFNSSDNLSWANGEGIYFSGTLPTAVYAFSGPRLYRHDVLTREKETVFNVRDFLPNSNGYEIWQAHSSDDDRVHSATLKNGSNNSIGCVVYREDVNELEYFPKSGYYDECQIDRSGNWLVIKEDVDGMYGEDNRIINVNTLDERILLDEHGAGGHSDLGHGTMIAADNWASRANTQRLWNFSAPSLQGTRVYYNNEWNTQAPAHVSHTNSRPGVPMNKQFACGSTASQTNHPHANEIICFGLGGQEDTLVVAPVMTGMGASGGGDSYAKAPKGNLDITGRYFVWTSNMRSSRLDVFMVKVPGHLLTGEDDPSPPKPGIIFSGDFEQ